MPRESDYKRIHGEKAFMILYMLAVIKVLQMILDIGIFATFFWSGPVMLLMEIVAPLPLSILAWVGVFVALKTSHVNIITGTGHMLARRRVWQYVRKLLFVFEFLGSGFFPGLWLGVLLLIRGINRADEKQYKAAVKEYEDTKAVTENLPLFMK